MTLEYEQPRDFKDLESLREWVWQQFQRTELEFNLGREAFYVNDSHAEPPKPRNGMIVRADGTNWNPDPVVNPGGDPGYWGYENGQWILFSKTGGPFIPDEVVTGPGASTDNGIPRWDGTDGNLLQDSSATISDVGDLTLNFTDDGVSGGPKLDIQRTSASPAASDSIGEINFRGSHSAGNGTAYAGVYGRILDPTDGSQDGQLELRARIANVNTIIASLANGVQVGSPTGGYQGVGTLNATGLFVNGFAVPGWTLIAQTTSPGTVANVDFNQAAIALCSELLVVVEAMTVSALAALRYAFSVNGGSSFLNAAYERSRDTTSAEQRNAFIEPSVATTNGKQGTCHVIMPPGGFKHFTAHGSRNAAANEGALSVGTIESTAQINFVRVTLSANNITAGNIRLFGKI